MSERGSGWTLSKMAKGVGKFFRNVPNMLGAAGNQIVSGVGNVGNKVLSGVGEVAGNVISQVGEGIVGPLGDMLFRLGESQRAYDKQERELEYMRSLPITQMHNLAEAGLNPNLIYGEGAAGAAGNYTPNEDKGQGIQMLNALGSSLSSIMSMIGGFQQIKAVSAGIDKTKEAVRTAALKNDVQEYLNDLYGVYEYYPDPKDPKKKIRKLNQPIGYFDPYDGGSTVSDWTGQKRGSYYAAMAVNKFRKAYNDGRISQSEYDTFMRSLEGYLDYLGKQGSQAHWNAKFREEEYNRLLNTWDPNMLRLLDLGESLAGDATQLLTRGIAGKGRRSPNGYYGYGQSFHGYTIR